MESQKQSLNKKKQTSSKKTQQYNPPRITKYGTMKKLTQANGGVATDGTLMQAGS